MPRLCIARRTTAEFARAFFNEEMMLSSSACLISFRAHHVNPGGRALKRVARGARATSHGQRATRGRVSSLNVLSFIGFIPNIIPNPNYRWGGDFNDDPNAGRATVEDVLRGHPKWRVSHEHGADDSDMLNRSFKCRDGKAGHQLLEALQAELYTQNERGCRIRRETQDLYYMCCDGVRVRLNEGKHEVFVEVPVPAETVEEVVETKETLNRIETICAQHSRGVNKA